MPSREAVSRSAISTEPGFTQNIYVHSSSGQQVPLSAFTRFEPGAAALALKPSGPVSCRHAFVQLAPDAALGDAVNAINRARQELNMPPSIQATFQGTAAAFLKSIGK